MRTKTILLTAALVAAGVATSMAQSSNVYSLNVVGYINVPVVANNFYLIENPLTDGVSNNINSVFSSLNASAFNFDGSSLYVFNPSTGYFTEGYNAATTNSGSWSPGTSVLPPGKGFFFQPAGSGTVTFVGSVVTNGTNILVPGFTLVGSPFPVSTNLVALGINAGDGDQVFRFLSSQRFGNGATYSQGIGWADGDVAGGGPLTGPSPNIAEAFFYFASNGTNIVWGQNFSIQ